MLHHNYHRDDEMVPPGEAAIIRGYDIIRDFPIFEHLDGDIYMREKSIIAGGSCAVDEKARIYVNTHSKLDDSEWAYVMAHALLHHAFGHFDKDNIPLDNNGHFNISVWNKACDIYITQFLEDVKFETPNCPAPSLEYKIKLNDERKIYEHLLYVGDDGSRNIYSSNRLDAQDMIGLEHPIEYKKGEENRIAARFYYGIHKRVSDAVTRAGGYELENRWSASTVVGRASAWFLSHFPLLGGLAASFKIIDDEDLCNRYDIRIAAVDASIGEIYCNTSSGLSEEEWIFVLAHEYLHAGLMHHKRIEGRDKYLWNIACDYCVNGWLADMRVGEMPEGVLYDKELKDLSAEAIYDRLIKEIRKYSKLNTLRGYGLGDIMSDSLPKFKGLKDKGVSLDEFFKSALREGLDFHSTNERGYIPAGLEVEIRALTSPPIPWEVELGQWFDCNFPPLEKHRSYARPSRRQSATPDIPRPRYTLQEQDIYDRTFAVIVDTSGSISAIQLGLSLGAIASYAASKDVRYIRIVFCDAAAYDQGYMTPDDLIGRVKVTGGGGTIIQPAVDLLEKSRDFPQDGPILIITDGFIEHRLRIHREHAYLLPKGNRLPFTPKGKVFYFKERGDF